jgi:hypothetical protein
MLRNSLVAAQLAASQDGLSSMEFVSYRVPQNKIKTFFCAVVLYLWHINSKKLQ